MSSVTGYRVAGELVTSDATFEVRHPYDGSPVATTCYATDADVERSVAAAHAVRREFAPAPARAEALDHVSRRLAERAEELAQLIIAPVDSMDEAFEKVNASRFGLQAGVFTHDLQLAFRASAELEVGDVIIGDVPSFRADQMPYGGVKDSGVGREGVRSAMTDLTEERVTVLTGITV